MSTYADLRKLLEDNAAALDALPIRLLLLSPGASVTLEDAHPGLLLLPGLVPPTLVLEVAELQIQKTEEGPPVQEEKEEKEEGMPRVSEERRLTEAQVREVMADLKARGGRSGKATAFARKFGVAEGTIQQIYRGDTYRDITGGRILEPRPQNDTAARAQSRSDLTPAEIQEIINHVRNGKQRWGDQTYFAKKFGVAPSSISNLYMGKTHAHLTGGPLKAKK